MAIKKSVKKVEIVDDNIVDLKSKEKSDLGFTVHKIQDEGAVQQDRFDIPIDRYESSQAIAHRQELDRHLQPNFTSPETVFDRPVRSVKYDADQLQQRMESFAEKLEKAVIKVSPGEGQSANVVADPKELIKVKFDKFVTLVASRDFLAVLEKNKNEDIILSSNLLTDLAGAIEEKSEKKTPVIFLVAFALGVIVTYLLINH